MHEIPRAAVIPTHNRPAELQRCVEAIAPQVDYLVVVDNACDEPVCDSDLFTMASGVRDDRADDFGVTVIADPEQPPNLSRLWNVGLTRAHQLIFNGMYETPPAGWDVAVLNDDAVPPPGWFDTISAAMRSTTAVAGCNDPFDRLGPGQVVFHGPEAPPSVLNRLAGWAMVLRGEWPGARFDESMRWCFSDDDISYRARLDGGLVYVGGVQALNTLADTVTWAHFAEQAGQDRAAFVAKHGVQPW